MLKDLRQNVGLTTDFVSKKLGIHKNTLYKYEQNQLLPSMNILLKMKDIYKCDYEELVNAYRMAKGVYDERKAKKRSKSAN